MLPNDTQFHGDTQDEDILIRDEDICHGVSSDVCMDLGGG